MSCWRETIVACQGSISSLTADERRREEVLKQINEDALKQESENDKVKPCKGKSAEEIAKDDALDVDSFDEAVSWYFLFLM